MCSLNFNTFSRPFSINNVLLIDEKHPYPQFDEKPETIIFEDTQQKEGKHVIKHDYFHSHNVQLVRAKLRFGDYAVDGVPVVVDTKRNIDELEQTVVAEINHPTKSARPAWQAALNAHYKFIILCESDEFASVDSLINWKNPVCYKHCPWYDGMMCNPADRNSPCPRYTRQYHPADGKRFLRGVRDAQQNYNIHFMFCKPHQSAGIIYNILINGNY